MVLVAELVDNGMSISGRDTRKEIRRIEVRRVLGVEGDRLLVLDRLLLGDRWLAGYWFGLVVLV